jgi:hypothetical protein
MRRLKNSRTKLTHNSTKGKIGITRVVTLIRSVKNRNREVPY